LHKVVKIIGEKVLIRKPSENESKSIEVTLLIGINKFYIVITSLIPKNKVGFKGMIYKLVPLIEQETGTREFLHLTLL